VTGVTADFIPNCKVGQVGDRDVRKGERRMRKASDLWERLTVGGVVVILVSFLILFVANLATTLCSAQLNH